MHTPPLEAILHKFKGKFASVMPFSLRRKRLCYIDLSSDNKALTLDIVSSTRHFSAYISAYTHSRRAELAIGKYAEDRSIYRKSTHFTPTGEEPRTVHLGVDIWVEMGTPVHTPLEGKVHSFADNDIYGDYGPTIILEHQLNGVVFHTLYGHLSKESLTGKRVGMPLSSGEQFASLGAATENGQWPSHLHFQIISQIGSWAGDFPGVAKLSEKQQWLERSPDPSLILGIPTREAQRVP